MNKNIADTLYPHALNLLYKLIATPSFSKKEEKTADIIENFLLSKNIKTFRYFNNVWATNKNFDYQKPAILLNSHHDTVKPNKAYTLDPFTPLEKDGKLFGLGCNDAGGSLVALIAAFLYFYERESAPYNFVLAATAEEEISGTNGMEALWQNPDFKKCFQHPDDFAIVGEPTLNDLATAEKGLLVLDCVAVGKPGHAAREEGDNAIYKAIKDIEWFHTYQFLRISPLLGAVKMNVTVIQTANTQHNVVPEQCTFVADIRVTDAYSHEEILDIVLQNVQCNIQPRSLRMRSTNISSTHPVVVSGLRLGKKIYGSPTCSDKALIPFPALKCGPGNSARSHSTDEFIYLHEIKEGIENYIRLIEGIE